MEEFWWRNLDLNHQDLNVDNLGGFVLDKCQDKPNKNGNAIQDLRRQRFNETLKNDLIIWQKTPPPLNVDVIDPLLYRCMSQLNTECDLETCVWLAGNEILGKFHVTHVLIPKQCGTYESCTTYGEEEVIKIYKEKQLYPLGWIHTHPTQSTFLSSL